MKTHFRFTRSLPLLFSIFVLGACSSDSTSTPPVDSNSLLRDQLQTVVDDAVESGLPGVSCLLYTSPSPRDS